VPCRNSGRRLLSATLWTLAIVAIVLAVIGIPYIFGGYARYDVDPAFSGVADASLLYQDAEPVEFTRCLKNDSDIFVGADLDQLTGGDAVRMSLQIKF